MELLQRGRGRRNRLTPELQELLCRMIERGSFQNVAARAAGIGVSTFCLWMRKGESATSGIYHDFYEAIEQARGRARGVAEARVWLENPLGWLRYGPGRDQGANDPGWTDRIEVEHSGQIQVTEGDYERIAGKLARLFGADRAADRAEAQEANAD